MVSDSVTPGQPQGRARVRNGSAILFVIIYLTMFFFGFVENIKGVSFPLIKAEFGVSYESQGGLVSIAWFGYVIFCLIASVFMQRFGIKKSVLAGYLLICAGSIATLTAPSFWTVSLALLVVSAGFGFFEVGTNALGTVVFTRRAALMMNLMHFFYGFGAILGPKTAGALTNVFGLTWRQVYMATIVPVFLGLVFIFFARFKTQADSETQEPAPSLTFVGALRQPIVWLFCVMLGFMEVIEFGAANWGGLYLQDVYGLDPRTVGASFVSLFYVMFTASRLVNGFAIERIGYLRSLYVAVASTLLLFALGFALGRQGIWLLPFTSLFIGVMWPTVMALCMRVFGPEAPVATSAIITVSGAINGVFQLVIGLTSQYAGDAWGYRSCLFYALVVGLLLHGLARKLARERHVEPEALPVRADAR